jgi:hypothetical protein
MPKPSSSLATKPLDIEIEAYNVQIVLISESINVKKIERDALRQKRRSAAEAIQRCKKASDAKVQEIKALKGTMRSSNAAIKKANEELSKMEVSSEAELDEKLVKLNQTMEHESISLSEEKRIIACIARLQVQRPRIIELERILQEAMESKQKNVTAQRSQLSVLESEYAQDVKDREAKEAQLASIRKKEGIVSAKVDTLLAEYHRVKAVRDDLREQQAVANKGIKKWADAFEKNRKFSRSVRQAVSDGRLADAVEMCNSQTEAVIERLGEDPAYRAAYLFNWAEQRLSGFEKPFDKKSSDEASDLEPKEQEKPMVKKEMEVLLSSNPGAKCDPIPLNTGSASAASSIADSDAFTIVDSAQDFEIPDVVRQKLQKDGIAMPQNKEEARERNRRLQEEALARKVKRDENKVKRREKALQSQTQFKLNDKSGMKTTMDGSGAIAKHSDEILAPSDNRNGIDAARVDKDPKDFLKTSKVSKVPLQVVRAMEPVPLAKRPVQSRRSVHEQVKLWYKRHELPAMMVAGLLSSLALMLLLTVMWPDHGVVQAR